MAEQLLRCQRHGSCPRDVLLVRTPPHYTQEVWGNLDLALKGENFTLCEIHLNSVRLKGGSLRERKEASKRLRNVRYKSVAHLYVLEMTTHH